jgi:hypothetical protein
MIANYDLRYQHTTFDFFGWLIEWAHRGATEIVFGNSNNPIKRKRFETIVAPGPAFLGLPSREGNDGERVGLKTKFPRVIEFAKQVKSFRRLRTVLPPRDVEYTVTLRQEEINAFRNSNREAWLRFASEIGATVIEDYSVKPIHLYERMALYAGARMNFGMSCGPMWMCSQSEYPCMIFGLVKHESFVRRCPIGWGENMPWCKEDQFVYWETDDYENICTRYRDWQSNSLVHSG